MKRSYSYTIMFLLLIGTISLFSWVNQLNILKTNTVINNNWVPEDENYMEGIVNNSIFHRKDFIEMNGALRVLLGQHEMNGIVKLNNGHLISPMPLTSDEELEEYAEQLNMFHAYLEQKGIASVFVMPPWTVSKYEPQLPEGVADFGNQNIDRFLDLLKKREIESIDFREEMFRDGINSYDMMYQTDHHWTTRAGFYAYGIIKDYIVKKTGCKTDYMIADLDHYTVTTYPNAFLGSRGQRTGSAFAGLDDFDLIMPDFETSIRNKAGVIGTVPEMMYDTSCLSGANKTIDYVYDNVLEQSLDQYTNEESLNNIKILIVGDSFAEAVNPYLAMTFREIRYIYNRGLEELTPEYIESYSPDIVIMMYYPEFLASGSGAFAYDAFR